MRALRAILLALAAACLAACTQTVLHEQASAQGTIIVTEDGAGLRALMFGWGGARQSVVKPGDPDHLELPYVRAALVGLALVESPRRMLVLGLGGGTLPMFLRRHYADAEIDVAEIDADVLAVAGRYFGFREDARMRVHLGDGRAFIERAASGRYDLVFLDAFGNESLPPHLATQEFLAAVRRALAPGGVAIGNVWGRSHNRLHDEMRRTYQEVFEDLYVIEVAGDVNTILFAFAQRRPLERDALAQRARAISTARGFRFDLGAAIEHSFMRAMERAAEAAVLRDAQLERAPARP